MDQCILTVNNNQSQNILCKFRIKNEYFREKFGQMPICKKCQSKSVNAPWAVVTIIDDKSGRKFIFVGHNFVPEDSLTQVMYKLSSLNMGDNKYTIDHKIDTCTFTLSTIMSINVDIGMFWTNKEAIFCESSWASFWACILNVYWYSSFIVKLQNTYQIMSKHRIPLHCKSGTFINNNVFTLHKYYRYFFEAWLSNRISVLFGRLSNCTGIVSYAKKIVHLIWSEFKCMCFLAYQSQFISFTKCKCNCYSTTGTGKTCCFDLLSGCVDYMQSNEKLSETMFWCYSFN